MIWRLPGFQAGVYFHEEQDMLLHRGTQGEKVVVQDVVWQSIGLLQMQMKLLRSHLESQYIYDDEDGGGVLPGD